MKKRQKVLFYVLVVILLAFVTILRDVLDEFEGGDLEVHFIDVGQGDSILIKSNNQSMLIDAGKRSNKDKVLNYLIKEGVGTLDYIVATHPHEDHIGGIAHVIDNIDVKKVIMPKATANTQVFENLLDTMASKGLKVTAARSGDQYDLDGSDVLILAPNSEKYGNLNNYSVGIKLTFGNTSFVFTGDAESLAEKEMVEKYGSVLRADLLKLGHHGSNTSSTDDFLDAVRPAYGVISSGERNIYGHPDDDVLERLTARNIKIYRTDLLGNIIATSDGETINFRFTQD